MNRTRSIALSLVVFLAASAVLMLPGTVAAAPTQSSVHNTVIVDAPIQPTFAIPGIFSLKFGDDVSTSDSISPPSMRQLSLTG